MLLWYTDEKIGGIQMKHLIIVKSAPGVDAHAFAKEAENHFKDILTLSGIHQVKVIEGIREHENRYHFIIEIDMDREALPAYNESRCHHEWKEKYGGRIEKKAIFDYE